MISSRMNFVKIYLRMRKSYEREGKRKAQAGIKERSIEEVMG